MKLRIALAAPLVVIWCSLAFAQDPNLQTRLETILPTPRDTYLPPKKELVPVQRQRDVPVTVFEPVDLTASEMRKVLENKGKLQTYSVTPSKEALVKLMEEAKEPLTRLQPKTIFVTKTVTDYEEKTVAPKPQVTLELPASYSYNSNALTSNKNRVADWIRASGPELTVKVPLTASETFAFYLNPGLLRYDDSTFRDSDALTSQLSYTRLLNQSYSQEAVKNPGTAQLELLVLKFRTISSFQPGFVGPTLNFYTAGADWNLLNIALGTSLCGEGKGKVNCFFANLSAGGNYTWVDDSSLDNAGVLGSATLGWNIKPSVLTLKLGGSLSGKFYARYTGNRQDLIMSGGPTLVWTPNGSITITAQYKYTSQISSQSPLDWDGYQLLPEIRFATKLN